jgi:hypothetical protein
MYAKFARLFVIKTRFEAFLIIYALALGATERGAAYLQQFPGWGGKLLFLACTGAVFMAGAKILDCLRHDREAAARAADAAALAHAQTIGAETRDPVSAAQRRAA